MQGYMDVPDLSELLANISTDIREDWILNSQTLGSTLINNAKTIKLDKIRENLDNRYETHGMEGMIPDFEKYVNRFIMKHSKRIQDGIDLHGTIAIIQGPLLQTEQAKLILK